MQPFNSTLLLALIFVLISCQSVKTNRTESYYQRFESLIEKRDSGIIWKNYPKEEIDNYRNEKKEWLADIRRVFYSVSDSVNANEVLFVRTVSHFDDRKNVLLHFMPANKSFIFQVSDHTPRS